MAKRFSQCYKAEGFPQAEPASLKIISAGSIWNQSALRILWVFTLLFTSISTHSASFDCDDARSSVEKLICESETVSGLDSRLARAYEEALIKAKDPAALKARQRQWLKQRSECLTENCLRGAYYWRIRILEEGEGATFYDPPDLKPELESGKAASLQQILRRYPMRPYEGVEPADLPFCAEFYKAMNTASPDIYYVEPVFRTEDRFHPGLGEYLACDLYQGTLGDDSFVLDELGTRNFRVYRLDLDGDPKTELDEYLYGEEQEGHQFLPKTTYARIDLKECQFTDGVPAWSEQPKDPTQGKGLNALVRYKNEYFIYVLTNLGDDYYSIDLRKYDISRHSFPSATLCRWKVPH